MFITKLFVNINKKPCQKLNKQNKYLIKTNHTNTNIYEML